MDQTRDFASFETIDWTAEFLLENRRYYRESKRDTAVPPVSANSAFQFIETITKGQLIKSRLWATFQSWVVLTVTGVVIGSIAAFLNIMTESLNDLKSGHCVRSIWLNRSFCCAGLEQCEDFKPWSNNVIVSFAVHLILCISFGSFASWVCLNYAPFAAGSGISEVKCIVSGFKIKNKFLSKTTLIIKSLMLPFTIASGIQVGKEGPSVHYAACCGAIFPPLLFNWFNDCPQRMSDFITAASSTGVAVAFGSPISGVLFSLEEICNRVSIELLWKCFYMSFIGTSTLQAWDPFRTGQIVMFSVRFETNWQMGELPIFILIGIFGGVYGGFVSKWNIKYVSFRRRFFPNSGVLEVFLLCLTTAIIGYGNEYMRLDMTRVMEILFTETSSEVSVLDLFQLTTSTIIRSIFIIISYGSKIPCGIFVPSMAVGATFGKLIGELLRVAFPNLDINPNIYSFLGAGSTLSGITGLTVTVVIIMFELTGAVKYIVPMMIIVLVVKCILELTGQGNGGIADKMIKFNGFPYLDVKEDHHLGSEGLTVGDVLVKEEGVISLQNVESFDSIRGKLDGNSIKDFPIVSKDMKLLGTIKRTKLEELDLAEHKDEQVVFINEETMFKLTGQVQHREEELGVELNDEVKFENLTINSGSSLNKLMGMFIELGCKTIYILNSEFKLIGCVNKKDMIRYSIKCEVESGHCEEFVNDKDFQMMEHIWGVYQGVYGFVINIPFNIRNYSSLNNSE